MKKLLTVLLVVGIAGVYSFSLTGCGKEESTSDKLGSAMKDAKKETKKAADARASARRHALHFNRPAAFWQVERRLPRHPRDAPVTRRTPRRDRP